MCHFTLVEIEDNLWELVLSSYHVHSRTELGVVPLPAELSPWHPSLYRYR